MSKPKPTISCLIPAYNEAKTIASVIEVVKKAKDKKLISEIIVVSDGSTDRTAEIARTAGADLVLELPKNLGKGGAVLAGVAEAKGENILMLDGDLLHLNPDHLATIIDPRLSGEADMVIGYLSSEVRQTVLPHFSGQ